MSKTSAFAEESVRRELWLAGHADAAATEVDQLIQLHHQDVFEQTFRRSPDWDRFDEKGSRAGDYGVYVKQHRNGRLRLPKDWDVTEGWIQGQAQDAVRAELDWIDDMGLPGLNNSELGQIMDSIHFDGKPLAGHVRRAWEVKHRDMRLLLKEAEQNGRSMSWVKDKLTDVNGHSRKNALALERRHHQAISKTAVNDAVNQARLKTFEKAGIELYQIQATLDEATTAICRHYHSRVFRIGAGSPRPPFHFQCRSVVVPVFPGEEPHIWHEDMNLFFDRPENYELLERTIGKANAREWHEMLARGERPRLKDYVGGVYSEYASLDDGRTFGGSLIRRRKLTREEIARFRQQAPSREAILRPLASVKNDQGYTPIVPGMGDPLGAVNGDASVVEALRRQIYSIPEERFNNFFGLEFNEFRRRFQARYEWVQQRRAAMLEAIRAGNEPDDWAAFSANWIAQNPAPDDAISVSSLRAFLQGRAPKKPDVPGFTVIPPGSTHARTIAILDDDKARILAQLDTLDEDVAFRKMEWIDARKQQADWLNRMTPTGDVDFHAQDYRFRLLFPDPAPEINARNPASDLLDELVESTLDLDPLVGRFTGQPYLLTEEAKRGFRPKVEGAVVVGKTPELENYFDSGQSKLYIVRDKDGKLRILDDRYVFGEGIEVDEKILTQAVDSEVLTLTGQRKVDQVFSDLAKRGDLDPRWSQRGEIRWVVARDRADLLDQEGVYMPVWDKKHASLTDLIDDVRDEIPYAPANPDEVMATIMVNETAPAKIAAHEYGHHMHITLERWLRTWHGSDFRTQSPTAWKVYDNVLLKGDKATYQKGSFWGEVPEDWFDSKKLDLLLGDLDDAMREYAATRELLWETVDGADLSDDFLVLSETDRFASMYAGQASKRFPNLITPYSSVNHHEWIAEAVGMYYSNPDKLRRTAPATYDFVRKLLRGEYFPDADTVATRFRTPAQVRAVHAATAFSDAPDPFDVTPMPVGVVDPDDLTIGTELDIIGLYRGQASTPKFRVKKVNQDGSVQLLHLGNDKTYYWDGVGPVMGKGKKIYLQQPRIVQALVPEPPKPDIPVNAGKQILWTKDLEKAPVGTQVLVSVQREEDWFETALRLSRRNDDGTIEFLNLDPDSDIEIFIWEPKTNHIAPMRTGTVGWKQGAIYDPGDFKWRIDVSVSPGTTGGAGFGADELIRLNPHLKRFKDIEPWAKPGSEFPDIPEVKPPPQNYWEPTYEVDPGVAELDLWSVKDDLGFGRGEIENGVMLVQAKADLREKMTGFAPESRWTKPKYDLDSQDFASVKESGAVLRSIGLDPDARSVTISERWQVLEAEWAAIKDDISDYDYVDRWILDQYKGNNNRDFDFYRRGFDHELMNGFMRNVHDDLDFLDDHLRQGLTYDLLGMDGGDRARAFARLVDGSIHEKHGLTWTDLGLYNEPIVYRGTSINSISKKLGSRDPRDWLGKQFVDFAPSSTSLSPGPTQEFLLGKDAVVMRIRLSDRAKLLALDAAGDSMSETEILLPPGTRFIVRDVSKVRVYDGRLKRWLVDLEAVTPDEVIPKVPKGVDLEAMAAPKIDEVWKAVETSTIDHDSWGPLAYHPKGAPEKIRLLHGDADTDVPQGFLRDVYKAEDDWNIRVLQSNDIDDPLLDTAMFEFNEKIDMAAARWGVSDVDARKFKTGLDMAEVHFDKSEWLIQKVLRDKLELKKMKIAGLDEGSKLQQDLKLLFPDEYAVVKAKGIGEKLDDLETIYLNRINQVHVENLSEPERALLERYKGPGYRWINDILRNRTLDLTDADNLFRTAPELRQLGINSPEELIDGIIGVFEKHQFPIERLVGRVPEGGVPLYRAFDLDDIMRDLGVDVPGDLEGLAFRDRGLMSTTFSKQYAENIAFEGVDSFTDIRMPAVLKLKAKEGTVVVPLDGLGVTEWEFALPNGAYRIERVAKAVTQAGEEYWEVTGALLASPDELLVSAPARMTPFSAKWANWDQVPRQLKDHALRVLKEVQEAGDFDLEDALLPNLGTGRKLTKKRSEEVAEAVRLLLVKRAKNQLEREVTSSQLLSFRREPQHLGIVQQLDWDEDTGALTGYDRLRRWAREVRDDDEWYYHVTTADAAQRIQEEGLVPGAGRLFEDAAARINSEGRVFLTDASSVDYWVDRVEQQLFSQFDSPPPVVVLRVRRRLVPDVTPDPHPDAKVHFSVFTEEAIPVGGRSNLPGDADLVVLARGDGPGEEVLLRRDQILMLGENKAIVRRRDLDVVDREIIDVDVPPLADQGTASAAAEEGKAVVISGLRRNNPDTVEFTLRKRNKDGSLRLRYNDKNYKYDPATGEVRDTTRSKRLFMKEAIVEPAFDTDPAEPLPWRQWRDWVDAPEDERIVESAPRVLRQLGADARGLPSKPGGNPRSPETSTKEVVKLFGAMFSSESNQQVSDVLKVYRNKYFGESEWPLGPSPQSTGSVGGLQAWRAPDHVEAHALMSYMTDVTRAARPDPDALETLYFVPVPKSHTKSWTAERLLGPGLAARQSGPVGQANLARAFRNRDQARAFANFAWKRRTGKTMTKEERKLFLDSLILERQVRAGDVVFDPRDLDAATGWTDFTKILDRDVAIPQPEVFVRWEAIADDVVLVDVKSLSTTVSVDVKHVARLLDLGQTPGQLAKSERLAVAKWVRGKSADGRTVSQIAAETDLGEDLIRRILGNKADLELSDSKAKILTRPPGERVVITGDDGKELFEFTATGHPEGDHAMYRFGQAVAEATEKANDTEKLFAVNEAQRLLEKERGEALWKALEGWDTHHPGGLQTAAWRKGMAKEVFGDKAEEFERYFLSAIESSIDDRGNWQKDGAITFLFPHRPERIWRGYLVGNSFLPKEVRHASDWAKVERLNPELAALLKNYAGMFSDWNSRVMASHRDLVHKLRADPKFELVDLSTLNTKPELNFDEVVSGRLTFLRQLADENDYDPAFKIKDPSNIENAGYYAGGVEVDEQWVPALSDDEKKFVMEDLPRLVRFSTVNRSDPEDFLFELGSSVRPNYDASVRANYSGHLQTATFKDARSLVHEIGHHIEQHAPDRQKDAVVAYWLKRSVWGADDPGAPEYGWRRLRDITGNTFYDTDEWSVTDKWWRNYAGKIYGPDRKGEDLLLRRARDLLKEAPKAMSETERMMWAARRVRKEFDIRATELISLGVEELFNEPGKLSRDKEFREFIIRWLQGQIWLGV